MDAECIVLYSSGIPQFHLAHHNGSFWQNQAILCMLPHRCWVFLTFEVLCLTLCDEEMSCEIVYTISAVSRAILKLVYWFEIPNSNPQMLKSVDFWCNLLSMFLVAEPRKQCFELFRMQNSQKFPGFCPWTPLGRAYSAASDSPAAQRLFSLLHSLKKLAPPKNCWKCH